MTWTRETWPAEALSRFAAKVAEAPAGSRHKQLLGAAWEAGHYVADGTLQRADVERVLWDAAQRAGLGEKRAKESRRAISDGIGRGEAEKAWYPQQGGGSYTPGNVRWKGKVIRMDARKTVGATVSDSADDGLPTAELPGEEVRLTWYPWRMETRGEAALWSWADLAEAIRTPMAWPSNGKDGLPLWSPAEVEDDDRARRPDGLDAAGAERDRECLVSAVHALALDYDDEPSFSLEQVERWWGAVRYIAHTSAHHLIPKPVQGGERPALPRGRVIVALSRPVSEGEFSRLAQWAIGCGRGVVGQQELGNARRAYFVPALAPGGYESTAHLVDQALDVDAILEQQTRLEEEATEQEQANAPEERVLELLDFVHPKGGEPRPRPGLRNVVTVLEEDSRWSGKIQSDVFRNELLLDGQPVTDAAEIDLACWLDRVYGIDANANHVHQAIVAIAARTEYDPVRSYLESLQWDGEPRLCHWLVSWAGVAETETDNLNEVYGTRWMISAVARVFDPGCQVDSALVLTGGKGRGKTSVLRILASLQWHSDSMLPIGSDEASKKLEGVWIYEIGEFASVQRAQIEAVKGFVTSRVDKYRASYGRNQISRPRRCVFAASTNDIAVLPEEDRRWWVRRVVRWADLTGLEEVRDQLWAEAVHRYRAGEPWHLDREQVVAQAADVDQYRQVDAWEQAVGDYIHGRSAVTTTEVLTQALKRELGDITKADEMRVGRILAALGRTRVRRLVGTRRVYEWTA